MDDASYKAGLREGRLHSLEEMHKNHAHRIDSHERRLQIQERITYGLVGAIALLQLMPVLKEMVG